jgi:hypothetical protein
MERLAAQEDVDWDAELENRRDRMREVIESLREASNPDDFARLALRATETADYGRAAEGFRVLIETIGLVAGTGAYRYLTGTPDFLAALVGALSAEMPMSSTEFFARVREEWGLIIGQEGAIALADELDGAELARNARRAESLLSEAGLAIGLSDRTVMVGERAARTS